jgi:hypothetical protein
VGPDVTAQDTADVTAVAPATHPAITVVKNSGDVTLTNVKVTDALSPNCNRTIGTLAPGASTSYLHSGERHVELHQRGGRNRHRRGDHGHAQDTAPVTAKAAFKPKDGEEGQAEGRLAQEAEGDWLAKSCSSACDGAARGRPICIRLKSRLVRRSTKRICLNLTSGLGKPT